MRQRSAAGGQTQETVVDMDVSADHRGSCIEKMWASGEPGAWKSCTPEFGGGRLGAPAISHGVAFESSIWKVMLGVSGMRLETAFPGV